MAIYPIWLDTVGEARPLGGILHACPPSPFQSQSCFPAGVIAYALFAEARLRRRVAYLAVVSIGTSLLALWQFKFLSYATWLAIPAIAILVARVEGTTNMSRISAQLLALFCLSPATIAIAAAMLTKPLVGTAAASSNRESALACSAKSAAAALETLPPGLVVSHIDLGPVVVATTHHRVLSAPYHRLPDGILEAHEIFAAPSSASLDKLSSIEPVMSSIARPAPCPVCL